MIETVIGALVALALLICAFALFSFEESETEFYSLDELTRLASSLPDGTRIYITMVKDGTDFYGTYNS